AVVDHTVTEDSRVFRDVAELGQCLEKLDDVVGTTVHPDVAVVYDWENAWAIDDAAGPRHDKGYLPTCQRHYRAFWKRGVPVDVIDMDQPLDGYKLVVAPMLYMVRPGVAERLEAFVEAGGTLVATYWSGIVDQDDLCHLGGFPGPLRKLLGIWDEETDALYPGDANHIVPKDGNALGLCHEYQARELCALVHAESAHVLARYKSDFYAKRPALTVNEFGSGEAYYVASRNDDAFLDDFYTALATRLRLQRALIAALPEGVSAVLRTDGNRHFVFLMNFNPRPATIDLGPASYTDLLTGRTLTGETVLHTYGVMVLAD
ncbi:beta-galactosidase trimerization domain-containing protein, partial [bacterium]|nr:beta-galactosidase trimerization domain-containing protein [bacterium]